MPGRHPVAALSPELMASRTPSSAPGLAGTSRPAFHRGVMLAGWSVILVFCLLFYDALLLNTLHKQARGSAASTAGMAASTLSSKISTGMRLGKKLENFRGLDRLVGDATAAFPENDGVAVLDAGGRAVFASAQLPFPPRVVDAHVNAVPAADGGVTVTDNGAYLDVAAPIADRRGEVAGYAVVRAPTGGMDASLRALAVDQAIFQAATAVAGLLALALLLRFMPLLSADGEIRKKRLYALCLGSFFVVMAANALFAMHVQRTQYAVSASDDARRVGALAGRDLDRLLLVGATIGQMDNVDQYLRKLSASLNDVALLEIRDEAGRRVAGGHPENTPVVPGMESVIPLHAPEKNAGFALWAADAAPERSGWTITVNVARDAYRSALAATALDLLTVVVVALIFMVEMFLLFFQALDARRHGLGPRRLDHARRSGLLRPLMFFLIMAMDMSISFLPLRMADLLTDGGTLSRDVLMGLPISAEAGMTGISVLLAGMWVKRSGIVPPMTAGLALMALGYAGSMLSAAPWQFIAARGVVGLGYGQCMLAAQAHTVKDGKLSDMFAGVYAGSLCGSALGAMLAERFGYSPVFLVSAAMFACLLAVPALTLGGRPERAAGAEAPPSRMGRPERMDLTRVRRLLGNGPLLRLIVFCLIPSALLSVGFLNYFLPVFLHRAEVSQSNIGRVFMLYCLILIYAGPLVGALVHASSRKALMVFWGGLAGALALLCFTVLPPLAASLAGAVLLAAATCFNVPAQSAYLLRLDIAKAIGVDQTMGLLNALTRIGQVLGPLGTGALVAAMGVSSAALCAGAGYAFLSTLFLKLGKERKAPAGAAA